jgi:hypothetical protein
MLLLLYFCCAFTENVNCACYYIVCTHRFVSKIAAPCPQVKSPLPHPTSSNAPHGQVTISNHKMTAQCCAECGADGGASLKVCKSCLSVKYCGAACQKKHWSTHKKQCKKRAPNYATRLFSKTLPPRRTVPFASYPCQYY